MKPWKKYPVIYEINTAVWLSEISREKGFPVTLDQVPADRWDAIARLPVDAVWFMGIWERSPAGIVLSNRDPGNLLSFRQALPDFTPDDNIGSPYCIRNYTVDPRFGGDTALAAARAQLALRGLHLLLDFVPNHVAHDHPWAGEDPGFFLRGTEEELALDPVTWVRTGQHILACGKDPWYPAWQDVLQVNAFHPSLRKRMAETLCRIAGICDGVRCDMAMLVMNGIFANTWGTRAGATPDRDFWEEIIPAVRKANPHFLFVAESYWDTEFALQQQGFDFCYDKRLYDRMEDHDTSGIRDHLRAGIEFQSRLIRFVENHDEPRMATAFPHPVGRAAAVIAATIPGARLFHEGQLEGRKVRPPVFLRRRPPEEADGRLTAFFGKLLEALRRPVFHEGTWQFCTCTGWPDDATSEHLLAWSWQLDKEQILVVINYSGQTARGRVPIGSPGLAGQERQLNDLLNGDVFVRNGNEMQNPGLYVSLAPWHFHLLKFNPF